MSDAARPRDAASTPQMELALDGGGTARVVASDGEHVVLTASLPSPPGSTLRGTAAGASWSVKVRGCKKEAQSHDTDAPSWRIEGRFVNLTRAQREVLVAR